MHRYLLTQLLTAALILLLGIGNNAAKAQAEADQITSINFLASSADWYFDFESAQDGAELGYAVTLRAMSMVTALTKSSSARRSSNQMGSTL